MSEKKCYATHYKKHSCHGTTNVSGLVIWLTDQELLLLTIKGRIHCVEVVNADIKKRYEIFMHRTVDEINGND